MSKIIIVDYETGNIKSITNALLKVGASVELSRSKNAIMEADGIVLPGVGAFSHGMQKLYEFGLVDILKSYADTGKPLLGICLGMQMLFSESEEFGINKGLGLIPGKVSRLELNDSNTRKLPHINWTSIYRPTNVSWENSIFSSLDSGSDMYFVHSFAGIPDSQEHILALANYSNYEFCSAVKRRNIYGCQFHPEKSAQLGLQIMKNFLKICSENG